MYIYKQKTCGDVMGKLNSKYYRIEKLDIFNISMASARDQ